MTEKQYTRKISKCYILEDDAPFESSPIRICKTRALAEHYKRILEPQWKEAFGFGLRIVEMKFYEEITETPTEIQTEMDNHIIQTIQEAYRSERTEIGKNVLKQLLEQLE